MALRCCLAAIAASAAGRLSCPRQPRARPANPGQPLTRTSQGRPPLAGWRSPPSCRSPADCARHLRAPGVGPWLFPLPAARQVSGRRRQRSSWRGRQHTLLLPPLPPRPQEEGWLGAQGTQAESSVSRPAAPRQPDTVPYKFFRENCMMLRKAGNRAWVSYRAPVKTSRRVLSRCTIWSYRPVGVAAVLATSACWKLCRVTQGGDIVAKERRFCVWGL